MDILYQLSDNLFETDSIEELKKKVEEHFSYFGYAPKVTVEGNFVHVAIEDDTSKSVDADMAGAQRLCESGCLHITT